MDLTQVSIVVRSKGNNPRILNPDFLVKNGIVPGNWEVAEVVVLPPLATVRYNNGLQFLLESEKLQIVTNDPAGLNWAEDLPRMAINFMSTLHHVSYGDIGLNFQAVERILGIEDSQESFTDALLREGEWRSLDNQARLSEMKLHYDLADCLLATTVSYAKIEKDNEQGGEFQVHANFHKSLTEKEDDRRCQYLRSLPEKHDTLSTLVAKFAMVTAE